MNGLSEPENVQTIVIGAGQAGLSVGYHLARRGLPFVILDANERIGDSWRNRWDSLRLFTPIGYDGLNGMPFPGRGHTVPTKDEMAAYLEAYAERFQLPVRMGMKVDRLSRQDDRFVVTAGGRRLEADNVIVAMANYQEARMPEFARELNPGIVQMHSKEYRNPSQLKDGPVLVVGVGNSGAEIAFEVARSRPTWLSGKEAGQVPFRVEGILGRVLVKPLFRIVFHRVLTVDTPIGRRVRPKLVAHGTPLLRVRTKDLDAAGVQRIPRTVGVRDGLPILADGRVLEVSNVIWCTGFDPGFSWIDLPVFGSGDGPMHERGVVAKEPGLYFVGLTFLLRPRRR